MSVSAGRNSFLNPAIFLKRFFSKPASALLELEENGERRTSHVDSTKFQFSNWANTFSCQPKHAHWPSSTQEVIDIVKAANERREVVKVVGTGHSPNDIAMTSEVFVSLDRLNKVVSYDLQRTTVTVQGGIHVNDLNEQLAQHGLMLQNLGSISDQSFIGAISTGTHGTGLNFADLGSTVLWMKVVSGTGELILCSADQNVTIFRALQCGLGALGIIVEFCIQCERLALLHSSETPCSFSAILGNMEGIATSAEHARIHWYPHTDKCVVWRANRVSEKSDRMRSESSSGVSSLWQGLVSVLDHVVGFHLLQSLYYVARYVPSFVPLVNRIFSYRLTEREHLGRLEEILNFDCLFQQHVLEFAVPYERTSEALRALSELIEREGYKVHFPIEVRFSAPSNALIAPSESRYTTWIGIIMYKPYGVFVEYAEYFESFSRRMIELGGRPHWAKCHSLKNDDFANMYGKSWSEFCEVRKRMDPNDVFLNAHLRRVFQQPQKRREEDEVK